MGSSFSNRAVAAIGALGDECRMRPVHATEQLTSSDYILKGNGFQLELIGSGGSSREGESSASLVELMSLLLLLLAAIETVKSVEKNAKCRLTAASQLAGKIGR